MAGRAWAERRLGLVRPFGTLTAHHEGEDEDGALADARRFGIDPETVRPSLIVSLSNHEGGEEFDGVWPENVPAVTAFLAAATQWRTAGWRFVGLDYAGAVIAWAARKIEISADLMERLVVVECAARDALNGLPGSKK